MSKYDPLQKHLHRLSGPSHEMSFSDLEGVLGCKLPASARIHRQWWENAKGMGSEHSQCRAWMVAGWRAKPNLKRKVVLFEKLPADSTEHDALSPVV